MHLLKEGIPMKKRKPLTINQRRYLLSLSGKYGIQLRTTISGGKERLALKKVSKISSVSPSIY